MVAKGLGSRVRSQLLKAMARSAAQAMGRMGRPDLLAMRMAPDWARRAGPCEPSATMPALLPRCISSTISRRARKPRWLEEPRTGRWLNCLARRAMYSPSRLELTMTAAE